MDGEKERSPAPVPCPHKQNINYSDTFNLIDKGSGDKAKYDVL